MKPTIKTKPSVIRELRADRAEMRKWAKDKSPDVKFRVGLFNANLRGLERDPHNQDLRLMAAMNFIGIAAAHGHYRNWPGE